VIHHYRLVIQYKGTCYLGWQVQPESAGKTIQGELNKALKAVSKSEEVRSIGSGRTDAGVHALGQVVKVSIPLSIAPGNLLRAINVNLPLDIKVISVTISNEEFLPTVHANSKEYHYRFTCDRMHMALQNDFVANFPFEIDLSLMREACKILIGKHDFLNFYTEGTDVSSTIREVFECEILEISNSGWEMLPTHYALRIVGSGFLKQMVRLLVGAIWNVGRGKITLEQFKASLGPAKTERLGPVAPPQGLYMICVNY